MQCGVLVGRRPTGNTLYDTQIMILGEKVEKRMSSLISDKFELTIDFKQAGAELGQAQLPTGIWLYWD